MKHPLIITLLAAAWAAEVPQTFAGERSSGIRDEITLLDKGSARLQQQIAEQERLIGEYQNAMEGLSLDEALGNKRPRKDPGEIERDNAARQRAIAVCRERIARWQGQVRDNAEESQRLGGKLNKAIRDEAKPREDNPTPEHLEMKRRERERQRELERRRQQEQPAAELLEIQRRQAARTAQAATERRENVAEAARLNLENAIREQQRQQAEQAEMRRRQQERQRQQMEDARRQREESWRRTQQAIEESRSRMNQNRGYVPSRRF